MGERDLRDMEIDEHRQRIQKLERQLAEARLGARSDEESEDTKESTDEDDEDEGYVNPFTNPNHGGHQAAWMRGRGSS